MEEKILEIINLIRASKNLNTLDSIQLEYHLRNDLEFTSFDLAELTVRIEDVFDIDIFEDGIVNTIGEIYQKLK
jgi:acyl carrier protein